MKKLNSFITRATIASSAYLATFAGPALAQVDLLGGTPVTPGTGYAANLGVVINAVLNFVMVIAALLVLLYLIWGGVEWITSGGDKSKTESARNKITAAVIGLIVLAAAYAIFFLMIRFLGFTDTTDLFDIQGITPKMG